MEWEKVSKEIKTLNWVTLLVLGSASYPLMGSAFTLGIILGGMIVIANFNLLQKTIRSAFGPDGVMKSKKVSIVSKCRIRHSASVANPSCSVVKRVRYQKVHSPAHRHARKFSPK